MLAQLFGQRLDIGEFTGIRLLELDNIDIKCLLVVSYLGECCDLTRAGTGSHLLLGLIRRRDQRRTRIGSGSHVEASY